MYINQHNFTRNMLFILFVLYFAQGLLYETGTFISQVSLVLIILISGTYFARLLLGNAKHDQFFKVWSFLLALNVTGFILTLNFDPLHVSMFKNILVCMISFYPFYFFAQNDLLGSRQLLWFFIFMLLINILQFYNTENNITLIQNREDVVNNLSYMFVALIPFVFLLKKNKLISGILISVILFYVIWSNKRGATITAVAGAAIFAYYQLRMIEKHHRVRGYLFSFIVIIGLGFFAYYNYVGNEYLVNRMSSLGEGKYSLRNYIYADILNSWFNSDNAWNYLLGFGFAGSLNLTGGSYAHSDWLELLSNFGLLGVGVYLYLFSTTIKYILNREWDTGKRIIMFTITAMWFATSLYSMWYTAIEMSMQAMLLAYLIGSKKNSLA